MIFFAKHHWFLHLVAIVSLKGKVTKCKCAGTEVPQQEIRLTLGFSETHAVIQSENKGTTGKNLPWAC